MRRRKLIDEENIKTEELAKKKEIQDTLRQQFLEDTKKVIMILLFRKQRKKEKNITKMQFQKILTVKMLQ